VIGSVEVVLLGSECVDDDFKPAKEVAFFTIPALERSFLPAVPTATVLFLLRLIE